MNEAQLLEKLRLIEALVSGGSTPGERGAAEAAQERILAKLREALSHDRPVEYRFSMADEWDRRLFVALLRRYDLHPYRYRRQRYTTVMVRVPERFVDETLWPEYQELSETLRAYLSQVTDRVIAEVLCVDSSEAEVVAEPPALTAGTKPTSGPPEAGGKASRAPEEPLHPRTAPTFEGASDPGATPRTWKVGRNAPCPCQSGKKFKKCCGR